MTDKEKVLEYQRRLIEANEKNNQQLQVIRDLTNKADLLARLQFVLANPSCRILAN